MARGKAERAKHIAELQSQAYKVLLKKVRQSLQAKAGDVLRACSIVDQDRSGYCHTAEFKVVFDTYLFEVQRDHYDRLVKPFTAAGDPTRMNYKNLVAQYRKAPQDTSTLHSAGFHLV